MQYIFAVKIWYSKSAVFFPLPIFTQTQCFGVSDQIHRRRKQMIIHYKQYFNIRNVILLLL